MNDPQTNSVRSAGGNDLGQRTLEAKAPCLFEPSRGSVTSPADVQLHIEDLVLHGFDSIDRSEVVSSVERELARLLAVGGVGAIKADIAHLDGGEFRIAPGARSETIGIHIAARIHQCVSRDVSRRT